jgi:hypothetical protein
MQGYKFIALKKYGWNPLASFLSVPTCPQGLLSLLPPKQFLFVLRIFLFVAKVAIIHRKTLKKKL